MARGSRITVGAVGAMLLLGLVPALQTTATAVTPSYTCGGEVPAAKPGGAAWTCSYNDEFSGTALDRTQWLPQQTVGSNFTSGSGSSKTCYLDSPNNVSVANGALSLTVRKESKAQRCGKFSTSYTAGSVSTYKGFRQMNGRFEIRAKLPATTISGLQETLWLWPDNPVKYGAWPASGEIDLAEFYSQYAGWNIPYIHYNYSVKPNWATNTNVVTALPAPYNQPGMSCQYDINGFNTYTVIWQPGEIDLYVNGKTCIINHYVSTTGKSPAPFDQPFFIALTQGLGVGANALTSKTPLPAVTQVDYVRVWK